MVFTWGSVCGTVCDNILFFSIFIDIGRFSFARCSLIFSDYWFFIAHISYCLMFLWWCSTNVRCSLYFSGWCWQDSFIYIDYHVSIFSSYCCICMWLTWYSVYVKLSNFSSFRLEFCPSWSIRCIFQAPLLGIPDHFFWCMYQQKCFWVVAISVTITYRDAFHCKIQQIKANKKKNKLL